MDKCKICNQRAAQAFKAKGGGDNVRLTGCFFTAGRNNKQPTNSFNKQIPVGISHEAEGPQLECFTGASCCALHIAAGPGSPEPGVLQLSPAQHGEEIPPGGGTTGCQAVRRGRDSGSVGHRQSSPCCTWDTVCSLRAGLRNVRNNTNINTSSHIPHLELMS